MAKDKRRILQKATSGIANLITAGIEKVTGKKYGRQTAESNIYQTKAGKVLQKAQNTALTALAVVGAGEAVVARGGAKVVLPQLAKSVGKSIIKNPVKATAVVAGVGVLSTSATARKAVKETNPLQFGQQIGTAIENPSVANITNIAKDNPLLTGLAGVAVGGVGAKVISSGVSAYQSYQLKEAITGGISKGNEGVEAVGDGGTFTTPETTFVEGKELSTGEKTTYKARSKKKKDFMNKVSQRVNVIVNQKNTGISNHKIYKVHSY